ncbi:MAG: pentapeptide repeat-containing protein [Archangium sp.]|nr:pentapeptide repeat-containing protein [Archangium sp.]
MIRLEKRYAEASGRTPTPTESSALENARVRAAAAGLPLARPQRDEGLMELSGLGQIGPELDVALELAERARFVQYAEADKKLTKLRRVHKLELSDELPAWIGELTHLRTLICTVGSKLPASLAKLQHLRNLHVDGSDELSSLAGLEKLRALEAVTCSNTPLGEDAEALAREARRLGGQVASFIPGIDLRPTPRKAPAGRKALLEAINADQLDDGSDLRKRDLSGARFEDAFITHDLRGARLAGTVWKSCDFEGAKLADADLAGAVFYDCYFGDHTLGKVRGANAVFIGCGGELTLAGADLRGAAFIDMEPDCGLDFSKADASKAFLHGAFCSEKEHRWEMKGANFRGATVQLDVTAGRRAELKKKKTSRLAWATDHLAGAKTDATTRIEYAALDVKPAAATAPTRAAEPTVDPKGNAAPILGTLHAANASLWLIVADADVAQEWRGAIDENDPRDDFQRALEARDGRIAIGAREGVRVTVGFRSGYSPLFASSEDASIRLVDASVQDRDRASRDRGLALRMGQWPIWTMPKTVGKFFSRTGVVALLLPYRDGAFPPKLRAKAVDGAAVFDPERDRVLVSMKSGPGIYEVSRYPFRPEKGRGDYEDDFGDYGNVIEISYCDRLPRSERSAT